MAAGCCGLRIGCRDRHRRRRRRRAHNDGRRRRLNPRAGRPDLQPVPRASGITMGAPCPSLSLPAQATPIPSSRAAKLGRQWAVLVAVAGQFRWPSMGRSNWPLTGPPSPQQRAASRHWSRRGSAIARPPAASSSPSKRSRATCPAPIPSSESAHVANLGIFVVVIRMRRAIAARARPPRQASVATTAVTLVASTRA